jgi:hypothetical protein
MRTGRDPRLARRDDLDEARVAAPQATQKAMSGTT